MRAYLDMGGISLVPDGAVEKDLLHKLYTQILLTEVPPSIKEPLGARWNSADGSIQIVPQAKLDARETQFKK